MSEFVQVLLLTTLAGACIPAGGFLAAYTRLRPQWLQQELRHFIIALGGGILLGAVALVLVPEGIAFTGQSMWSPAILVAGGLTFFYVERILGLQKQQTPQLLGMLLDFVPEAIALGGMFVGNSADGVLLALLIGLQNLPEGFNTYRELHQQKDSSQPRGRWQLLRFMVILVMLGPAAGLFGYYYLGDNQFILGTIMLFAGGGILYLIFQDIAPQSKLEKHWAPPIGAVIGFCIAMIGQLLLEYM